MKRILIFLLAGFITISVEAREPIPFTSDSGHFSFKYPANWKITDEFPASIWLSPESDSMVTFNITRYEIAPENQIGSHENLLEAIGGLYQTLGITSGRTDSIAYNDDHTISFEDEYSRKIEDGTIYYYYIKGIICRPLSGGQGLYLLAAEMPVEIMAVYETDIRIIAESFTITEDLNPKVYPQESGLSYLVIFAILALITLFFARNRKIQRSRNPLGADTSHYWRCPSCRLVNHIDHTLCQRCGTERNVSKVSGK